MAIGAAIAGQVFGLADTVITRLFPDPEQRAKAQLELARLQRDGDLKEIEISMSAIVMEAQSQHKLVALARPMMLYTMYGLILSAIPMGFLFAFNPEMAALVVSGFQSWLSAIPTELWTLFGAGYLGYANKRSEDKARVLGQEVKPGLISKILG